MRLLVLCLCLFVAVGTVCGQVEIFRNTEDTSTYIAPEDTITKPPQFGNGEADFFRYIEQHFFLRNASFSNNFGSITVRFSFFVDRNGSISDYKHIFGSNQQYSAEIERVISNMPNWSPGYMDGKKKRVLMEYDLTLQPIANFTPPMIQVSKNRVTSEFSERTKQFKWFIVSGAVLILATLWIIK